jgi:Nif-specific regulatory protein
MATAKTVTRKELPLNIREPFVAPKLSSRATEALPTALEEMEKAGLIEALEKTGWNKAKAARIIGITPRQIGYKIKKYGIHHS